MNRIMIAVAILSLSFPLAGITQANVQTASMSTPLSPGQLHNLMKTAHTTAEYKQLAGYFHQQEAQYRAEATAAKAERDRRAQINAGLMQKYPRPVDSAQYLYESSVSKADNAALQARHYEQLATAPTERYPQTAAGKS
jgi:hypothetical protein